VCIVVYVKYRGWVVKWVREDDVLARNPDGVLPDGAIVTYGCNYIGGELGNVCVRGWVGGVDSLS